MKKTPSPWAFLTLTPRSVPLRAAEGGVGVLGRRIFPVPGTSKVPGLVSGSLPRTSSSERPGRPSQSWPVARSVTAGTTVHARGTPTDPRSRRPSPAANDPRAHSLSGKSLKSQGGPSAGSFPVTTRRERYLRPKLCSHRYVEGLPYCSSFKHTHTHTEALGHVGCGEPRLGGHSVPVNGTESSPLPAQDLSRRAGTCKGRGYARPLSHSGLRYCGRPAGCC